MDLNTIRNMDKEIVTISAFNKGQAGRIFDEVENVGHKVVFKNNRRKAVILSPVMYDALIEMVADQLLLEDAERRMSKPKIKEVSFDEAMKEAGIKEEDLKGWEDVEVE